ncbi:hypothetical protein [Nodularia sp. NIES-3585]|uniref:hypothetical protein n=1 Tax=Nodularia sp. NIES-3585 TaxID=1973477 RepID=UPI000B5CCA81|nr:hypothetical protein [Nodularia sp. NIES-3585]GAX34682.1 hypothetical protein NIES3585_06830 [Nodularia sp. NIES-3585]
MSNAPNVAQVFSTFTNLTNELKLFTKTDDLKIAFDSQGNVYLIGDDFQEQIHTNFTLWREVRKELRILIAKHRSQYKPDEMTNN